MVIEFEKKGSIAVITLNRPEARNAVNAELTQRMEEILDAYEADDELWAAILTAKGAVFCAGADLKEAAAGGGLKLSTEKGGFAGITGRERNKPLIAAITGSALAGGLEIALACDLIVCAEETVFGLPEVKRSLVAGAGGLFRLPRSIGMALALEAILTGDPFSSERAYQLGLVNAVVPSDAVMHEAIKLAERIVANAPLAVQASRRIAKQSFILDDESLFKAGNAELASIAKTADFKEGLSAFIEKRSPDWTGR